MGADAYAITHLPSGTHIFAVPMGQQKLAKGIVIDLLALAGVDWETPNLHPTFDQLASIWTVCHPPPQRKVITFKRSKEPLVLEPDYPHWFNPSDELVTLDTLNVKAWVEGGWPAYLADAGELLWREVIVATFTAGAKASALPDDVPIRSHVHLQLPPGFPRDYSGVRQIVEGLWKLGSQIDALADAMCTYWETRETAGFDLAQWLTWEQEFKRLVQKGWCNWSIAATLFEQLPRADKEKITGILGFVGNRKQGYGPLGRKTFLRSEKLPTMNRYRRIRLGMVEAAYEELE